MADVTTRTTDGEPDGQPDRPPDGRGAVRSAAVGCVLVGLLVLVWILATPPSAGPDEPDHVERGAALVRGQVDPTRSGATGFDAYTLPPWVGFPDPVCFAFDSFAPASCATSLPTPSGPDIEFASRAADYPVWGHLLPGLGTFTGGELSPLATRLLGALVPVLLIGVALHLATRTGWGPAGALLLATTPMAWFLFAVVSPSGVVIAGGIALWSALVRSNRRPDGWSRWLTALAWASLVLPRRDGLVWAVTILSVVLIWRPLGLRQWFHTVGRGPQIVILLSTLATMAWGATSGSSSGQMLVVVPLLPFVVVAARRWFATPSMSAPVARVAGAVGLAVVALGFAALVMVRRPGGFDREVLRIIVGRTGLHLDEAIGVLGWLDTPIPDTMAMLWLVTLGVLAGACVVRDARRDLLAAAAVILIGVAASWVLEMSQGDPTGTYWQGRYYLPFLAGAPIVLGCVPARVGRFVGAVSLVILNVALAAAMRRWAVGNAGPMVPWAWDTYDTVVPPALLLVASALLSVALWTWIDRCDQANIGSTASGSIP
jgi:hypothetical protein